MIYSYSRGHKIIYINNEWVYADNLEKVNDERACKRCGNKPTSEGHDFCIKNRKGVISACCGHGIDKGYVLTREG